MSDDLTTRGWSAERDLPAPPEIPGFELLGELGRGGMGVVYRARQLAADRLVAVKVIRDVTLADARDLARFRIEREVAARLVHPNIVRILASGEHQALPYLAMELVEGGGLERLIDRGAQPVRPAADFVRKLAVAVDYAHSLNVVHRDLKPANILLAPTRDAASRNAAIDSLADCEPKIADFGLAKRLDSATGGWTQAGAVLGTGAYMSPEQAGGDASNVGPAADVYALGAILYELLTGRPPFRADTWQRLLEDVLHSDPTAVTRLRSEVPEDLNTICLKCLEKDQERRYLSAAALAADLERFLQGATIAATPIGAYQRLQAHARRDGYELRDLVGRGPRATVYRAADGALGQIVAIKVFRAGLFTRDNWEARLGENADVQSAWSHPQIVTILRAGWWDESPYLAIDYATRGNLGAVSYSLGEALELAIQLADVLGYLHRQGAVHGNLKPSNVLLGPGGVPLVADFLAMHASSSWNAFADDAGLGIEYAAPELLDEAASAPRRTADIYSLGAILYQLVAGRPPFVAPSRDELLRQIRDETPAPPSAFNSHAPASLDFICLRCLRKHPWSRYSRAYDVGRRLRLVLDRRA